MDRAAFEGDGIDEDAGRVVAGYLQALSGVWLAENVRLTDARAGRAYRGRIEASEWSRRTGLAGATSRDVLLVVSGSSVAAECRLDLHEQRSLQLAAFAEVEAGEITVVRMYRGGP